MVNRIYCAASVFTLLSIGFIISGILLIAFSDSIIKKAVNKVENNILFLEIFIIDSYQECQLKQGTVAYKLWRDPPVPFYISIYVFDLVNQNEFLNGGKPHLIQRGPFVYT